MIGGKGFSGLGVVIVTGMVPTAIEGWYICLKILSKIFYNWWTGLRTKPLFEEMESWQSISSSIGQKTNYWFRTQNGFQISKNNAPGVLRDSYLAHDDRSALYLGFSVLR